MIANSLLFIVLSISSFSTFEAAPIDAPNAELFGSDLTSLPRPCSSANDRLCHARISVSAASPVEHPSAPAALVSAGEVQEGDLEVEGFVWIQDDTPAPQDGGDDQTKQNPDDGESLIPLPPSHRRRNWALSIGIILTFTISILTYIYRSSLPSMSDLSSSLPTKLHIPRIPFSLPTLKSNSNSRHRFRPAPKSLLRWSQESDPRGTTYPLMSNYEEDEEEYEEVGLLPSPSRGRAAFDHSQAQNYNYGAVRS